MSAALGYVAFLVVAAFVSVLARRATTDEGDKVSARWLNENIRLRRE